MHLTLARRVEIRPGPKNFFKKIQRRKHFKTAAGFVHFAGENLCAKRFSFPLQPRFSAPPPVTRFPSSSSMIGWVHWTVQSRAGSRQAEQQRLIREQQEVKVQKNNTIQQTSRHSCSDSWRETHAVSNDVPPGLRYSNTTVARTLAPVSCLVFTHRIGTVFILKKRTIAYLWWSRSVISAHKASDVVHHNKH